MIRLLFIATLNLFIPLNSFAETETHIPPQILKRAEKYIIDQVGEEYYRKNYSLILDNSYSEEKSGQAEYFVFFDYLRLSKVVGEKVPLLVRLLDQDKFVPTDLVASVKRGQVIEPHITKKKAFEIVKTKEKGLTDISKAFIQFLPPSWLHKSMKSWSWKITFSEPRDEFCSETKTYMVDVLTGTSKKVRGYTSCA